MSRFGRQKAVTLAVLTSYIALLTVGQSLHNHGGRGWPENGTERCRFVHAATSCVLHHSSHQREAGATAENGTERISPTKQSAISDDHPCLVCRFLNQKTISAPAVAAVLSYPLSDHVKASALCRVMQRFAGCADIRGPPGII